MVLRRSKRVLDGLRRSQRVVDGFRGFQSDLRCSEGFTRSRGLGGLCSWLHAGCLRC